MWKIINILSWLAMLATCCILTYGKNQHQVRGAKYKKLYGDRTVDYFQLYKQFNKAIDMAEFYKSAIIQQAKIISDQDSIIQKLQNHE